jgi:hypothetical protein
MRNKLLMFSGIIAPLAYVVAVAVGGILQPGYSHIAQYVSELIEAGAPNKAILDPIFAIYDFYFYCFYRPAVVYHI